MGRSLHFCRGRQWRCSCSELPTSWFFSIIRNILHGHDPESEVGVTQPGDDASRKNPDQVSISFIEAGTLDTSNRIGTE